jgi:hypothetical protein
MLLPLMLFGLVSLIWIVVWLINKKWVKSLQRNLAITFISILFLLHPKLTEQGFGIFRCIDIDDGVSMMRLDTDIECYSGEHVLYCTTIGLPILLIWVTALPIIALMLLCKYIKSKEDNLVKQYFLILYQGLKQDKFYWEFANTLRKVLILVTFMLSSNLKLLLSMVIVSITGRVQIYLKPYRDEQNNEVEILALVAGMITMISGLVSSQPDVNDSLNLIFTILVFISNSLFILNWTYLLVVNLNNTYGHRYKIFERVSINLIVCHL